MLQCYGATRLGTGNERKYRKSARVGAGGSYSKG